MTGERSEDERSTSLRHIISEKMSEVAQKVEAVAQDEQQKRQASDASAAQFAQANREQVVQVKEQLEQHGTGLSELAAALEQAIARGDMQQIKELTEKLSQLNS